MTPLSWSRLEIFHECPFVRYWNSWCRIHANSDMMNHLTNVESIRILLSSFLSNVHEWTSFYCVKRPPGGGLFVQPQGPPKCHCSTHTHTRQTDILTQCFAGPGTGARPGCGHLKYGIRFEVKVWSLTGTRAHEHDRPAYGQSDKEMEQEDDKMDGAKGHQG